MTPDDSGNGGPNGPSQISPEQFYRALASIDPAMHAGEGGTFYSTDEYARPADITSNPWTRAGVGREGEYYPTGMSGLPRGY